MLDTIKIGEEVIDLNLPFPRMMEVKDDIDGKWKPRKVICINPTDYNNKIIAIANSRTVFYDRTDLIVWKFCREIPKKKQMTVAEIEAKLGYGVEVINKD